MKVSLAMSIGTVLGVLSLASGYQQMSSHNSDPIWFSQRSRSYQYYYPHQAINNQRGSRELQNQMSKLQWSNPTSKPQWWNSNNLWQNPMSKPQWQNPMAKPQWQNPMSKPQWQNPMSKPQWQNPMSKLQWQKPSYSVKPQKQKPSYKVKPFVHRPFTSMPAVPVRARTTAAPGADREWPSYIPPITMIKLPKDTPPDA